MTKNNKTKREIIETTIEKSKVRTYDSFGDVLTSDEACLLLGICRQSLYGLVKNGAIPRLPKFGKGYHFAKRHLIAYLENIAA